MRKKRLLKRIWPLLFCQVFFFFALQCFHRFDQTLTSVHCSERLTVWIPHVSISCKNTEKIWPKFSRYISFFLGHSNSPFEHPLFKPHGPKICRSPNYVRMRRSQRPVCLLYGPMDAKDWKLQVAFYAKVLLYSPLSKFYKGSIAVFILHIHGSLPIDANKPFPHGGSTKMKTPKSLRLHVKYKRCRVWNPLLTLVFYISHVATQLCITLPAC